jgi:hypothetical protein
MGVWGDIVERGDDFPQVIPSEVKLEENYPNPFNAATTISFDIPFENKVTLSIYNMLGQRIENLVDGWLSAGHHAVNWDASTYSSGVYFYRLQYGDYISTRKMNLVK